jgi:hypothetical protein
VNEAMTTRRGKLEPAATFVGAMLLSAFAALMHFSHIEGRLQGPGGWTGWVMLDAALVALPVLAPAITFAVLIFAGRNSRQSGRPTLTAFLYAGLSSAALVILWI